MSQSYFSSFSCNQEELDNKLFEVLGEKTEADEKKPMKKKKEKPAKTEVLFHNKTNKKYKSHLGLRGTLNVTYNLVNI